MDNDSAQHIPAAYLVYDGLCPFCSQYVRLLRLRESVGFVQLLSARSRHPVVERLHAAGYNLNEGIALVEPDTVYFGEDCMMRLALLTSPVGAFNRMNAALFRRRGVIRVVYPILKAGRRVLLLLMRRPPIGRP